MAAAVTSGTEAALAAAETATAPAVALVVAVVPGNLMAKEAKVAPVAKVAKGHRALPKLRPRSLHPVPFNIADSPVPLPISTATTKTTGW